jgi:hypothetical protein
MKDERDLGSITMWELAFYISAKLNKIDRNHFKLEPEDLLKQRPSREELLFFFTRLCRREYL